MGGPSNFRPLQDGDTASPRRLEQYLRDLERTIVDLSRQLEATSNAKAKSRSLSLSDLFVVRDALQSGGAAELDLTDLIGINATTVDARIPRLTVAPDPVITPYDTYILVGSPYSSLWQIDRSVNPPVAVQVASVATHDLLSTTHTDTLAGTVVRGDLIVGNSTPKWSRFAKGSANQILRMDGTGTDPAWGSIALTSGSDYSSADVTYAAGNFTASSGNWTVDAGDQTALSYVRIGGLLIVQFTIEATDVSATPTDLRIAIPNSYVAASESHGVYWAQNAGGAWAPGMWSVAAAGTRIELYRDPSATVWSTTVADDTSVAGFAVIRI